MTFLLQHIYFLPIIISAILSLRTFGLGWPLAYKLFSILLFLALATEIYARAWVYHQYNLSGGKVIPNNIWIYTLSIVPQYLLYMSMYYLTITIRWIRKAIVWTAGVFSIFAILNFTFWQKLTVVNSHSHVLADLIVILLALGYFEELRRKDEIIKLSKQPMVWISFGACIFHLLNIPYILNINALYQQNIGSFPRAFLYLYQGFIIVMYLLFSIAFLCPTPRQK